MSSKLIELEDGVLIEVEVPGDQVEQISGSTSERVDKAISSVRPILLKACQPIVDAYQELNKELSVSQAEVELGLGFEAEGNVFIAKGKANASL
ncbi:MAG: CU044_2847 family protein, partial [Pseudomonadota bacterium]